MLIQQYYNLIPDNSANRAHEYRKQFGIDKALGVPALVRLNLDTSKSDSQFYLVKEDILVFARSTLGIVPRSLIDQSLALSALTYIILVGFALIGGLKTRGNMHSQAHNRGNE